MPVVALVLEFVPGVQTFTKLAESEVFLRQYGWTQYAIDNGPAGKITTVERRQITWTLGGKPGATDENARKDVESALNGVGLWKYRVTNVTSAIQKVADELPVKVAQAAGSAAGAGLSSGIKNAGVGTSLILLIAGMVTVVAAIGVGVFVIKRG